jgi:hypothetical protein
MMALAFSWRGRGSGGVVVRVESGEDVEEGVLQRSCAE